MTQYHTSKDLNPQLDNTVEASNLPLSILLCFAKQNVNKIHFVFSRFKKFPTQGAFRKI
jgi:hypothetical protein